MLVSAPRPGAHRMPDPADHPSVLAVLIVRGGADVRQTLGALGAQNYPRLGVLCVDTGANEDDRALLVQALGQGRVIGVREEPVGKRVPEHVPVIGWMETPWLCVVRRRRAQRGFQDRRLVGRDGKRCSRDCADQNPPVPLGVPLPVGPS